MLQTGGLIRDLSVRELVAMMASLYPEPLTVDEVIELTGIDEIAEPADAEAVGRPDAAGPFRGRARQRPGAARARRADRGNGRRGAPGFWATMRAFAGRGKTVVFATHYLEEADANADRIMLMARGQSSRTGSATEIKARSACGRSGPRCPTPTDAALAGLPGVTGGRAPRRRDRARDAPTPTSRSAPLLEQFPDVRDIEISGAGLEQAFLQLTGDTRGRSRMSAATYTRYELAPHVPQQAVLHLLAGVPARPVLRGRWAEPQRVGPRHTGIPAPLYYMVGMAAGAR